MKQQNNIQMCNGCSRICKEHRKKTTYLHFSAVWKEGEEVEAAKWGDKVGVVKLEDVGLVIEKQH